MIKASMPIDSRAFDPCRIVHCPNSHVQSCVFRFLNETLARETVMQCERDCADVCCFD